MNCRDIMNAKPFNLKAETPVETALAEMKKAGVRIAPVVDSAGTVMGLFSLRSLLQESLPVSMVVEGGAISGFGGVMIEAAPGISRRLQKAMGQTVAVVMNRRFAKVYPESSIHDAMRHLVEQGDAVIVMDPDTAKLLGVITEEDTISALLSESSSSPKASGKRA